VNAGALSERSGHGLASRKNAPEIRFSNKIRFSNDLLVKRLAPMSSPDKSAKCVFNQVIGRPSTPEAFVLVREASGILDAPLSRGMTAENMTSCSRGAK
jgi:hypothetical protein